MQPLNPLDHPVVLSFPRWVAPSEWIEHVPFAMLAIDLLRPNVVVELGAHYGVSYCAFCQAVDELQLPTRCYAVDTWQGDPHDGFYGREVFEALAAHHNPLYGEFSRLIVGTFDDALQYFADNTIDLLHIDGYHTYEAVRHDFETWRPKLSARAVVLFHDVNVREREFGVWRLWDELTQAYPHFTFTHGHGLGVLAVGPEVPPGLQTLLEADDEQAWRVRTLCYQLGLRLRFKQERDRTVSELSERLVTREQQLTKAEEDVATLHSWVAERDARIVEGLERYDRDVRAYLGWLEERDAQIAELHAAVEETQAELHAAVEKAQADTNALHNWLAERDQHIAALETNANAQANAYQQRVAERDAQLAQQASLLAKAEADVATLHAWVGERDALIRQLWHDKNVLLQSQARFAEVQSSLSWKLMQRAWRLRARVLPHDSLVSRGLAATRRAVQVQRHHGSAEVVRRVVRRVVRGRAPRSKLPAASNDAVPDHAQPVDDAYARWIAMHEPGPAALLQQADEARRLAQRPLITIVTPVYNPPAAVLAALIDSVLAQSYTNWELVLVDASPDNIAVGVLLAQYAARDERVRVIALDDNLGIVANTNAGLGAARGAFVAFVDHDDTLAPFALYEVARALNAQPDLDLIYSDHDLLSADDGRRIAPLFKPDWSPVTMLSAAYATHLTVVRAELLQQLGGLTPGTDGVQDWDMILRASERTTAIAHIPQVLYHWRDSAVSTASDMRRKPYVMQRQVEMLSAHLQRQGIDGHAYFDTNGFLRVVWPLPHTPLVSIIIPSRNPVLLERCLTSIRAHTDYPQIEFVVLDTTADGMIAQRFAHSPATQVVRYTEPFNYSRVNNIGADVARGELLLFLNDDIEAMGGSADWLTELVRWGLRPEVGVVGAKLLRADGSIQHAGVVVGLNGFAGHPFDGCAEGINTIYGRPEWYRNYSAVTGACQLIRRSVFEQIGGFDERMALCGSDVALCLQARAQGLQVLYTPFARLRHLESASRGASRIPNDDFACSYHYYLPLLRDGDPFYNPNLSYWSARPELRQQGEEAALAFARRYLEALGLAVANDDIPDEAQHMVRGQ